MPVGANLFAKAVFQTQKCIDCTALFANKFAPTKARGCL
ncbi:hypothetical protein KPSA3_05806 [Pseudomonas syringae pv. actinidiae]|uniref:Uncharacterized protein n=1 Tax=Pseudomonas syringae pv. actinidiae TaxID=103796 RepID=A0AAN4Q9F4_PSESF|nr:hypothetical protein KPSA3_05806 [Pseudomonas syringae pv. actinidiae]